MESTEVDRTLAEIQPLLSARRYQEAEVVFRKSIDLAISQARNSEAAMLASMLAKCLARSSTFDKAMREFLRAETLAPNDPYFVIEASRFLASEATRATEARAHLKKIDQFSESADAVVHHLAAVVDGLIEIAEGDILAAIEALSRAKELAITGGISSLLWDVDLVTRLSHAPVARAACIDYSQRLQALAIEEGIPSRRATADRLLLRLSAGAS